MDEATVLERARTEAATDAVHTKDDRISSTNTGLSGLTANEAPEGEKDTALAEQAIWGRHGKLFMWTG